MSSAMIVKMYGMAVFAIMVIFVTICTSFCQYKHTEYREDSAALDVYYIGNVFFRVVGLIVLGAFTLGVFHLFRFLSERMIPYAGG